MAARYVFWLCLVVCLLIYFRLQENGYHRLRGSASTVLTAIRQVNGRWRILSPHRIETHEPIATKFRKIDYVCETRKKLQFIHKLTASDISKTAKITKR